jgi:hypothetical protein
VDVAVEQVAEKTLLMVEPLLLVDLEYKDMLVAVVQMVDMQAVAVAAWALLVVILIHLHKKVALVVQVLQTQLQV